MKLSARNLALVTLTPLIMAGFNACSSQPDPFHYTIVSAKTGEVGGVTAEVYEVVATVTAIDPVKRKVMLETLDGKKTTVKVSPDAVNFDKMRVGDKFKARLIEEVVVYLAEAGAPAVEGGAGMVALAAEGEKPGGILVETLQVTAKVAAIDLKNHKATLEFPDGTRKTVTVRKDVDLTQRKVGESVVIRTTETMMISVTAP